jgi:hypothetical protein
MNVAILADVNRPRHSGMTARSGDQNGYGYEDAGDRAHARSLSLIPPGRRDGLKFVTEYEIATRDHRGGISVSFGRGGAVSHAAVAVLATGYVNANASQTVSFLLMPPAPALTASLAPSQWTAPATTSPHCSW